MSNNRRTLDFLSNLFPYLGIVSVVMLMFGLSNIDNYSDWVVYSLVLVIFGLVLGSMVYCSLIWCFPDAKVYKNKFGIGFAVPVFCFSIILSLFLGNVINEYSIQDIVCGEYVIIDLGKSSGTREKYYIFIQAETKIERLSFYELSKAGYEIGDKIELCVITGALGFKYYKPRDWCIKK